MTRDQERLWAEQERKQSAQIYNTANFPILVAHHGHWDIYSDTQGRCAAIPVVEGCRASYFGDMDYLKHVPDLVYLEATAPTCHGTTLSGCSLSSTT